MPFTGFNARVHSTIQSISILSSQIRDERMIVISKICEMKNHMNACYMRWTCQSRLRC